MNFNTHFEFCIIKVANVLVNVQNGIVNQDGNVKEGNVYVKGKVSL